MYLGFGGVFVRGNVEGVSPLVVACKGTVGCDDDDVENDAF